VVWVDGMTSVHRVWLAADGAAHAEKRLPRVTVGRLTRWGELRVRCSAACEVRVVAVGVAAADVNLRMDRAGTRDADFDDYGGSIRFGRTLRLRVTYGAPDGTRTRTLHLTRRIPDYRPQPNVRTVGLRAARRGNAIRVTFRLNAEPPTYQSFFVTGSATRDRFTEPIVAERASNGDQRSFKVTLRPAAGVRYVTLYSYGLKTIKQVIRVR
jgi:hypothetical protein